MGNLKRRELLLGGLAAALPFASRAGEICTHHELAQYYRAEVRERLNVPRDEGLLYGAMTEVLLPDMRQGAEPPQYLLAVDKNPNVQAAFLFWRLLPGRYELVGASPVCTGSMPRHETPEGVFEKTVATPREIEFCAQQPRVQGGRMRLTEVKVCARAADRSAMRWLGTTRSDGDVLLPPSLLAFLKKHGVLDAAQPTSALPFPGWRMVVVDSERGDRPDWCPSRA